MRILVDPAVYELRNKGNVAQLQYAVMRLHDLWPAASIEVMTAGAHLLKLYCPETRPVSSDGRHDWSYGAESIDRLHAAVPAGVLRTLFEVREEVWHRYPSLTPSSLKQRLRTLSQRPGASAAVAVLPGAEPDGAAAEPAAVNDNGCCANLEKALAGADLVVATGGGYLCDSDKVRALDVLDRLEQAGELGKVTAMVGQGVGPMEDPELCRRASAVMPHLDLILVREERVARPLLESLGVPGTRIVTTGDDAVELAYGLRAGDLGAGIGVSVRMTPYTALEREHMATMRQALHASARRLAAPLVAVPISLDGYEADQKRIGELLKGYPQVVTSWRRFEPTAATMERVGQCRVVVASAYHAAVFALAQGIPVVGLVRTPEYAYKFNGLTDHFGAGCQVLTVDDAELGTKLQQAIMCAYQAAPGLRPQLLKAAEKQIGMNRAAYAQLQQIYEQRTRDYTG